MAVFEYAIIAKDEIMLLFKGERLDDLQINGLYIIQKTDGFCYGTDAVLLSSFANVKKGSRVMDLCTGTGIIPLLLSAKTQAVEICGIEIIPAVAKMAKRSILYNKIDYIKIKEGNVCDASNIYGYEVFDTVTCNPPYERVGGGIKNPDDIKACARHEIFCSLDDVVSQSSKILKYGGNLSMVHRANRIADVLCSMRKFKIEPKRLQMVAPYLGKEPNLILIEGIKGAGPFVENLPTLYIYDENGNYTNEINEIYERNSRI